MYREDEEDMGDVNGEHSCNKLAPREDGEEGSWRMQPGPEKDELRVEGIK